MRAGNDWLDRQCSSMGGQHLWACEHLPQLRLELVHRREALEARGDAALPIHHEHPWLRRQPPLCHGGRGTRRAKIAGRLLWFVVDLNVDEVDLLAVALLQVLDDVELRTARPALAERRRGERHDQGLARFYGLRDGKAVQLRVDWHG